MHLPTKNLLLIKLENLKGKNLPRKKAKSKSSERTIDRKQLYDLISDSKVDTVIAAISGSDGLELTHHSIISGKKYFWQIKSL
ncbi:MAG: hypothetical protein CM15mP123_01060 [Gammaproteobacteria bacterium]|nr:MAG: hypothetical protein CM15mP123_01060 [Gammaproteobacteria bacterium]